jgi:dihydroneopterin aldolase
MSAPDRILLEGLRFYGYHGVIAEEAKLGQEFVIDLCIATDLRAAGQSDSLSQTISYAEVVNLTQSIVEEQRYNLLEALAEALAAAILSRYLTAQAVTVRVTKPHAPIPRLGSGRVAVEISRARLPSSKPSPHRRGFFISGE